MKNRLCTTNTAILTIPRFKSTTFLQVRDENCCLGPTMISRQSDANSDFQMLQCSQVSPMAALSAYYFVPFDAIFRKSGRTFITCFMFDVNQIRQRAAICQYFDLLTTLLHEIARPEAHSNIATNAKWISALFFGFVALKLV